MRTRSAERRTLPSSTAVDAERATDLAHVGRAALELEGRGSRGDLQPAHAAQRVDDLLGDAVAEVLLVARGTHVGEGQDRDRRVSRRSGGLAAALPRAAARARRRRQAPDRRSSRRPASTGHPAPACARCRAASHRMPTRARRRAESPASRARSPAGSPRSADRSARRSHRQPGSGATRSRCRRSQRARPCGGAARRTSGRWLRSCRSSAYRLLSDYRWARQPTGARAADATGRGFSVARGLSGRASP